MAKVIFTYPVQSIKGKVADGQYFSQRNGKNLMAVYDADKVKGKEPTEAQTAAREKFSTAATAARELLKDNAQRAELQKAFVKAGSPGTLFGWVFKQEYAKL